MVYNSQKSSVPLRNSNVELLRIMTMFGILLWHVTVHGFGMAHISGNERIDYELVNSTCTALFAPCVNLFILISGYYGVKLRASTLIRFDAQAVFYSFTITILMYYLTDTISAKLLVKAVLPIIGNKWWFLNAYLMLLILSPILNEGIARLDRKQHIVIIALFVVLNGISSLVRLNVNGSNLQSFILIYLVGQFLYRYKDEYKILTHRKAMNIVCLVCLAVNLLVVYGCLIGGHQYPELTDKTMVYLSYSNPVIILQSVSIFCIVLSITATHNKRINAIAKHVFAVYLITEAIGMPLYQTMKDVFAANFILGLLLSASIFSACIIIEAARNSVYELITKRYCK